MSTERPILFSGPMIRALLDGTKTQTRRIIKPQPTPPPARFREWQAGAFYPESNSGKMGIFSQMYYTCPYGKVGDLLWVRETWGESGRYKDGIRYEYQAHPADGTDFRTVMRWRPSIHMPREASRILLEITEIRAERLHGISEEDAIAEGIARPEWDERMAEQDWNTPTTLSPYYDKSGGRRVFSTARECYSNLWDHINGETKDGTWEDNPSVWVVSFKRVIGEEGGATRQQSKAP